MTWVLPAQANLVGRSIHQHLTKWPVKDVYYNNFHTTAVCSPTRAALKSGRNHHQNNMGSIIETGTAFPGNTGSIPQDVAPVAEMLRLNGYSTAAFGKWHELAAWEANMAGPYTRWPTGPNGDLISSMAFLVEKPTSGHHLFMMVQHLLNYLKIPIIISWKI